MWESVPSEGAAPPDRLLTPLGGYAFGVALAVVGFWVPVLQRIF